MSKTASDTAFEGPGGRGDEAARRRLSAPPGAALLPAAALLLAGGCEPSTGPGEGGPPAAIDRLPRSLTQAETEAIEANNVFGFRLLRTLDGGDDPAVGEGPAGGDDPAGGAENLFISPLSASMALGMTLNGADGTTFDGMAETLGLGGTTLEEANRAYRDLLELLRGLDPAVDLRVANAVWLSERYPVRPGFVSRVEGFFGAAAENLDFTGDPAGSAARINDWVSASTEGEIERLVDASMVRNLVAFLANAVYFRGDWRSRFDEARTRPGEFRRPDGTTVQVPMMRQEDMDGLFGGDEEVRVADLPYGGGAFSMTLLVPRGEETVDDVVAGLDRDRWRALLETLGEGARTVSLPRFELTYEALFNGALKAMGMEEAFDPTRADFSRLSDRALEDELHISFVKQKTFVSVDEEGTEAAAATGVGAGVTSGPPTFTVDRPFVVAIRERLSGTILFLGKVVDPTAG